MKKNRTFKRNKQEANGDSKSSEDQYRKMPTFIILFSGLSIFFIGLYLTIEDSVAIGLYPGGRNGQGRGRTIVVNGPYLLFFGLIFMIFPIYILTKKYLKNKRK